MILFRYILRDFLKFVGGTVFLCLFLFVLFDFIHKSTRYFAIHKPTVSQIIQFYVFQLPTQAVQALPIGSLLAGVVTMLLFSRTNEITAMRAAGMGPLRIAAPIAIGGLILSMLSFVIGELIAPVSSKRMRYVEQVLIEKQNPDEIGHRAQWLRRDNQLYHFDEFNPETQTLTNVRIVETGPSFRPKQATEAQTALYQPDQKLWLLKTIRVLQFAPNGTLVQVEHREQQQTDMPIEPTKIQRDRRPPAEMSIFELFDSISKGRSSGINVAEMIVEMHMKIALHFASFVVCLMGLKFAYRSERSAEPVRGVLIAVAIGLSYWFLMNSGKALGKRGALPPMLAAWMANVTISCIAGFELWRVRKK